MKTKSLFLIAVVVLSCSNTKSNTETSSEEAVQTQDPAVVFNFDNDEPGKLPSNWTPATSTWSIVADGNNKAMKQTEKNSGSQYNICVEGSQRYQNLSAEVRVKASEGGEDQGGGLVWRYQDAQNYYIMRANPLENNLRLYQVVNGNRKQMESANVKMKSSEWFTLKVVMTGNSIDCYYDGQKLLSSKDDTFPNAGLVGFWTKADAISLFDDLKITILK
ncbi:MAG: DUF1080 domain-containing protein [Flammeovirgaceae bacterium]|nr:DUF1080 domain-containing protein [Flammeovirgaceae bacterium]MBP9152294.1 DUF1080 domain-containing protein [Flavobacteriales bacterium]